MGVRDYGIKRNPWKIAADELFLYSNHNFFDENHHFQVNHFQ